MAQNGDESEAGNADDEDGDGDGDDARRRAAGAGERRTVVNPANSSLAATRIDVRVDRG